MVQVVLDKLRKVYGDNVIVDDLSLQIAPGELIALVGPSGCGKSTLLRMVAGLLNPDGGRIVLDGRDVTAQPPGARDIAMVFQSYALYPHMSVRDNIAFPLRVRRRPESDIAARVEAVAEQLGLSELLERRPRDLSGGQRQRVAMGRAIIREPKVFLFDEPLSNLDAALRARMRGEIAALHRRLGVTTIYVTHDQHEAMTLASRLVLLNRGRIEQAGPPLEVYAAPASRFAGEFLGSPGMSFLPARRDGESVLCGSWRIPLSRVRSDDALPAELWLGVRPEALGTDAADGLWVLADWVERTGSETLVYARLESDATPLVIRLGAAQAVQPGARLRLLPRQARLFDRQSGRAVAEVV